MITSSLCSSHHCPITAYLLQVEARRISDTGTLSSVFIGSVLTAHSRSPLIVREVPLCLHEAASATLQLAGAWQELVANRNTALVTRDT
jgi:hypothetical protein